VNLCNNTGTRNANVSFGASPSGPFATFNSTVGLDFSNIATLSAVCVHGAFAAVNRASEIGSPGPPCTPAAGSFFAWLAAKGYAFSGIDADSDGDGLTDRLKFFFNLNRNSATSFGNLPAMVVNGTSRELHFRRLSNICGSAGTLGCSASLDGAWPAAVPGVDYEVISESNGGEETAVSYRLLGNDPSKFFRLEVE
jgi:hypothetical protein